MDLSRDGLMSVKDREEIEHILEDFQDEPFLGALKEEAKRAELAEKLSKFGFLLAVIHNGRVAAFATGYANDHQTKCGYGSIWAVRSNLGLVSVKVAMQTVIEVVYYMREQGMDYVRLEVQKSNKHAKAIYERMGFVPDGDETELSVFMKLDLRTVFDNHPKAYKVPRVEKLNF